MANYFTSLFGYLVRDKEAHAKIDTHNHDGKYSPVGHKHDEDYAPKEHTHGEYVVKGDFAFLTGQLTTPSGEDGNFNGSLTLTLPDGFTGDNCVIIALLSKNHNLTTGANGWTTTVSINPNYLTGNTYMASLSGLRLHGRIMSETVNISIDRYDTTMDSNTFDVRVVLMKFA